MDNDTLIALRLSRERCLLCEDKPYGQSYDGNPYCKKHYDEVIFSEYYEHYKQWVKPDEPSGKLKYLMGRIVSEYFKYEGSYLSAARLRDRGYDFEKIDDNCFTFYIERHPGAFNSGGLDYFIIVQKWNVDMSTLCAKVIEEIRD